MQSKNYDAIIIGAGAAGLMCAAFAAKRGHKILLIDKAKKVGEKIRISGGGRCNFTNIHTTAKNFISKNPHFCVSALQRFSSQDFIELVKKHQIAFHEKTLGQLFCDSSSQQIIDMLLNECTEGAVEILLEHEVKNIEKISNDSANFRLQIKSNAIEASELSVSCTSLIIASGGLSIPKMGASGFGYDVAKKFGLKIIETYPALVPLTLEESMLAHTKNLAGVATDCEISIKNSKTAPKFREAILFTHRGLSGPAILQISSYLEKGDELLINLLPQYDIFSIFLTEKTQKPKQEIATILAKYLPKSLASFIVQNVECKGWIADLSNQKLKEIASSINSWTIIPSGSEGYLKAEVTGGGIDTDEISSKTFEAKKVPNLYFIGEVLDVTGQLGGFNFQFAWASGFACAQYI